jgi:hypothetical protein
LPTPDEGSSVTYALSRRAGAVRGSRDAADDLELGSGVGPAFRLRGVAMSAASLLAQRFGLPGFGLGPDGRVVALS